MNDKKIVFPSKGYLEYGIINPTKIIDTNQPRHIWKIIEHLPKDYDGLIIDMGVLFVEENKRDRGVATHLVEALIRLYQDEVICANINTIPPDMDIECVSLKQYLDELYYFYKKLGFKRINSSDSSVSIIYPDNSVGKYIKKSIREEEM